MVGEEVDGRGGHMNLDGLPVEWASERFTVVDAGGGEIALHSPCHGRFVRLCEEAVDAKGGPRHAENLGDWQLERFTVVDAGGGLVALHCKAQNRFVRMEGGGDVNAKGGRKDVDSLPRGWDSERFVVRGAP